MKLKFWIFFLLFCFSSVSIQCGETIEAEPWSPGHSLYGGTGYITLYSVETLKKNQFGFGTRLLTHDSEDFDYTIFSNYVDYGITDNLEMSLNIMNSSFSSGHYLEYTAPPSDLKEESATLNLKYRFPKRFRAGRKEFDAVYGAGLIVSLDDYYTYNRSIRNILNVLKETYITEKGNAIGYLMFGGYDLKNRNSITLQLQFGDNVNVGIGVKKELSDNFELIGEYMENLYKVEGLDGTRIQLDKNQFGIGFRYRMMPGLKLGVNYSTLSIGFEGKDFERFNNRINVSSVGLEYDF